jgi:hypothetical protein
MKICSPGFTERVDVVDFHIARIKRLLADQTDAFGSAPQRHATAG